jgi:hypothetical protein
MTENINEEKLLIRYISTDISDLKFKTFENWNFGIVSYFVFRASDFSRYN